MEIINKMNEVSAVNRTPTNIIIVNPQRRKPDSNQTPPLMSVEDQNMALHKKVEILGAFARVQNDIIQNLMKKESCPGCEPSAKVDYNA